jgi:hypothetical protein
MFGLEKTACSIHYMVADGGLGIVIFNTASPIKIKELT